MEAAFDNEATAAAINPENLQSLTSFTGRSTCPAGSTFSTFGFASFLLITVQTVINIVTGN
jgi:hypothetical protein